MRAKVASKVKKYFLTEDDEFVEKALNQLAQKLGIPEVKEVLTLYYEVGSELILRCDVFKGYISRLSSKTTFKSQNLGSVVGMLADMGYKRAAISIVLQLSFPTKDGISIVYLKDTLISKHQFEITSSGNAATDFKGAPFLEAIFSKAVDLSGIESQISKVKEEEVLNELYVPNEKILNFCKELNISWTRNTEGTYFHRINSTSNDYSEVARIFSILFGVEINSTKPSFYNGPLNLPSVSIVIPCFNVGPSIIKTLKSIDAQKPKGIKFEVILVDDGSEEPAQNVLDRLKVSLNYEPIVIRKEKNTGISQARNIGAAIAKNDILMFIDGDIVLTNNYLYEHLLRHKLFQKAVLVSFKENVESDDSRISDEHISDNLELPNYKSDLRVNKYLDDRSMGYYKENYLTAGDVFTILSDTNYFKNLGYGRRVGVYDLPSMVIGHNFTMSRKMFQRIGGFDNKFEGYGLEDSYIGIKSIADGAFIIPVLSCGVYHINHVSRRGDTSKLRSEFAKNAKKINELLSSSENESSPS